MEECEGVAVCSKSLSHLEDVSIRFIEWIELLRAQGVDKIFLKVYAVHKNVMKVTIIQCPLGFFVLYCVINTTKYTFRFSNIMSPLVL